MKFAFFDVNTQKAFVESFGTHGVPFAGVIRENLMHLTSIAVRDGIPLFSFMFDGEGCEKGSDMHDKIMDSYVDGEGQTLMDYSSVETLKEVCKTALDACGDDLEVVFVYGLPASSWVVETCRALTEIRAESGLKIWVVNDAIKDTSAKVEMDVLKNLKSELGVRSITTRNLDKFVKM